MMRFTIELLIIIFLGSSMASAITSQQYCQRLHAKALASSPPITQTTELLRKTVTSVVSADTGYDTFIETYCKNGVVETRASKWRLQSIDTCGTGFTGACQSRMISCCGYQCSTLLGNSTQQDSCGNVNP